MAETLTQKQVRLILERQCRAMAEQIDAGLPAGVGFTLFLFDFGPKGNVAYVSSAQRADVVKLVREWVEREERLAREGS